MEEKAQITLNQNRIHLSGVLNSDTVMSLYDTSLALFEPLPVLELDLSAVVSSDSAGIALLIEWLQYAKQRQKLIYFFHVPAALLSLAKTAGLSELIAAPAV